MEKQHWLVINYNLPTEPSRARVSVWRSLKKLGALNVQQSMWILPFGDENKSALDSICQDIENSGGEALVMRSEFLRPEDEQKIISYFNKARDEEYKELLEKCTDFFKEIDMETARKNFSFAEIEENEEELDKLVSWHSKIKARDLFEAGLGAKAGEKLQECRKLLEDFSNKVYEFNDR